MFHDINLLNSNERNIIENEENVNNTLEKLEELKAAIESGPHMLELKQGPAIEVKDLKDISAKYLTKEAQEALLKTAKSQIVEYDEFVPLEERSVRKFAQAVYLSTVVRSDKVEEGVKAISEEINKMVEKGWVHSFLASISSLTLARQVFQADTTVVFCFPIIKPEFYEMANSSKYATLEGCIGPHLHSVDADEDLKPGEFLADCHLGYWPGRDSIKFNKEARIFQEVQEYLKYLPEGTRFLGYRECAIMDLSYPIELKFYNELFQNITRVKLNYVREVAFFKDKPPGSQVKQFNLICGLEFYKKDPLSGERSWFPKLD